MRREEEERVFRQRERHGDVGVDAHPVAPDAAGDATVTRNGRSVNNFARRRRFTSQYFKKEFETSIFGSKVAEFYQFHPLRKSVAFITRGASDISVDFQDLTWKYG